MEITGTLLDGEPVDWESYRGKVVLVDFWATWCGPCRAEIPNVLEMYEAYHDKGFDVLGVSLDATPEAAEKYVAENKLPWSSIFPKNEDERRVEQPAGRLLRHHRHPDRDPRRQGWQGRQHERPRPGARRRARKAPRPAARSRLTKRPPPRKPAAK